MPNPLISVIIPTYNDKATLEVAVRSMIEQTYTNLEIIIVDDNSTDGTDAVGEALSRLDPRIRYMRCPYTDPHRIDWRGVNVSVGYLARNYAIKESKGAWITFQDADDASLKNRIEVQYALAVRYNATVACISWQQYEEGLEEKTLDIERIFSDHGEEALVQRPDVATAFAREAKGVLMADWFPHQLIPFTFKKWFPGMRTLFFRNSLPYPGADNSMLFKREVTEKVQFRKLIDRQWPARSGRGVGRDFLSHAAEVFKNSYTFTLPLYLWRVNAQNSELPYPPQKYLV